MHGDTTTHVDIELEHQQLRHGDKHRAEFTVSVAGTVYRAGRWAESLHGAIDLAIDEITAELSRDKEKHVHMVRRSASKIKDYLRGWRDKV